MTTMLFGKYRGQPLSELPDDYVLWLLTLPDLRDPLMTAIHSEADRRMSTVAKLEGAP